jgi:hypothetical protein
MVINSCNLFAFSKGMSRPLAVLVLFHLTNDRIY